MFNMKISGEKIVRSIFNGLNHILYFTPIIQSNYRFRHKLLIPLYHGKLSHSRQTALSSKGAKSIIYMVLPETTFSGGLSDRLRGIVTIYSECKKTGLPFRIVFEPLHLEEYLKPNSYDWRISEDDICWDTKEAYPCVILTYHKSSHNKYQYFVQHFFLRHFMRKPYKQIHVYSNMMCKDEEYGPLFHELFEPTDELQQQIDFHLDKLGGKRNYITCTFRFRQLLGDFKEGGDTLPVEKREPYIERCIQTVKYLHEQNADKTILVTADSSTFLSELRERALPYVYLMPGKVVHIGFTFNASHSTYLKSFLDMYMISLADTVYLVRDKLMYHSGFPYRAALLGGARYKETALVTIPNHQRRKEEEQWCHFVPVGFSKQ